MNRFTEIRIDGFRRLCGIELPLKPLNVVIGANGVGKTSLLDVFDLLKASAEGKLAEKVSDLQGFSSIQSRFARIKKNDTIQIACTVEDPPLPKMTYDLMLHGAGSGYTIPVESLWNLVPPPGDAHSVLYREGDIVNTCQPAIDVQLLTDATARKLRPNESLISQLPFDFTSMIDFHDALTSLIHCRPIDARERAPVRLPQSLRPADLPGANGENLAACLYTMRESTPVQFEAMEDTLRTAFPSFRKLAFPSVAAGMLVFTWHDANFSDALSPHELSEGTLRFLWLATLLASPGLPAVTLIDEPEISLHPELLSLLAELFRDASTRTQLIVATQSDSLIRFLKPEEVVVMDMGEDGLATATRADTFDLESWLQDYTLDEVWRMGRMGGRA